MNEEEMRQQIASLNAEVSRLHQELESKHRRDRDVFSRRLAVAGIVLIGMILVLIGMAIWMRYQHEPRRYSPVTSDVPIGRNAPAGPAVPAPPASGPAPTPPSGSEPVAQQPKGAREVLDDYIDREARKTGGGNTYSLSLNGIKDVVDALVKTGQLAKDEAIKLKDELTKSAIATTSEIVKETAKAVIARFIAPESEPKATAGGAAQLVQVNVYGNDRHVVTSRPNPAPAPKPTPKPKPKPKPQCPTPVPAAEPARCPVLLP